MPLLQPEPKGLVVQVEVGVATRTRARLQGRGRQGLDERETGGVCPPAKPVLPQPVAQGHVLPRVGQGGRAGPHEDSTEERGELCGARPREQRAKPGDRLDTAREAKPKPRPARASQMEGGHQEQEPAGYVEVGTQRDLQKGQRMKRVTPERRRGASSPLSRTTRAPEHEGDDQIEPDQRRAQGPLGATDRVARGHESPETELGEGRIGCRDLWVVHPGRGAVVRRRRDAGRRRDVGCGEAQAACAPFVDVAEDVVRQDRLTA